jgi:peptidoglycan/LPS O-acetylase OafA/YrhL
MNSARMKRNLQLDFLRFLGVFLVVVHHYPFHDESAFGGVISVIQTGGWIGVDLFFVLSGYLIAGLMIKEYNAKGSFNIRLFLIRRGFKIYPAYYFFILYQFLYSFFITNNTQRLDRLWHEVFFFANYAKNNNGHLWSISVEEHFYVFLAIAFVLMIKFKKVNFKTMLGLYLALLIVGLSCRIYNYVTYPVYDFNRDYTRSHLRFDAMFFGVLIAFLVNYRKHFMDRLLQSRLKPVYFVLCLLFLSTNFIYGRYDHRIISVVNLSLNPICFGYILVCLVNYHQIGFLKVIKPFAYVGMYSYSIYLFHIHFISLTAFYFARNTFMFYASYLLLALIGGIIVSKVIEYPFLKLRERFFPSR